MTDPIQGELFSTTSDHAPNRVFLDWSAPLLEAAVDFLLHDVATTDLGDCLVLVSTQQAGRRLREGLATRASELGEVFVPPRVATPRLLLTPPPGHRVADSALVIKVWIDVLRESPMEKLRHLFPVDPPDRSFNWALDAAVQFIEVRRTIADGGHDMAAVAKSHAIEADRWREMASLEKEVGRRLARMKLVDPIDAERTAAESPDPVPGPARIVVLAVPDPTPLALTALRSLSGKIPVDVVIHAPDSEGHRFDAWGRPVARDWQESEIPIRDSRSTLHVLNKPRQAADHGIELLSRNSNPAESVAFCLCDPEWSVYLQRALEDNGRCGFDPAGESFSGHEIANALRFAGELLRARDTRTFGEFLRLADVQNSLAGRYKHGKGEDDASFRSQKMLSDFDRATSDHLPASMQDLERCLSDRTDEKAPVELRFALSEIGKLLDAFNQPERFNSALASLLTFAFSARSFQSTIPDDRTFLDFFAMLQERVACFDSPLFHGPDAPSPSNKIELLLRLTDAAATPSESDTEDFDLNGWLEILWEDAPHLILAGLQDGAVPEAITSDPFIPHQLRESLGLRTNDDRYARDAYLLTSLCRSRENDGRLDILLARTSDEGEPIRPSRLLFHCPDTELSDRALQLFEDPPVTDTETNAAWSAAWKVTPPAIPADHKIFERISITGFATYLNCPFRFYLGRGLGMEAIDPSKSEMDPRDFGIICHGVLETLGHDTSMRDSSNHNEVAAFLETEARNAIESRYGDYPPASVRIQTESICERLRAAGRMIAAERKKGWQLYKPPEWQIHEHHDFTIGGMKVTGTIDWIERHEKEGTIRILDFKTKNTAARPEAAHVKSIGKFESPDDYPAWVLTENEKGKPARWINLQLPLYLLALREMEPKGTQFECGYFQLPIAVSNTEIQLWSSLDGERLDSARNCAEAVVAAIKDRRFWPPSLDPKYDDYEPILFGDPEETVDAEAFTAVLAAPPAS